MAAEAVAKCLLQTFSRLAAYRAERGATVFDDVAPGGLAFATSCHRGEEVSSFAGVVDYCRMWISTHYPVITLRFSTGTWFMTRIAVFDRRNCGFFFRLTACSIDCSEASTASNA